MSSRDGEAIRESALPWYGKTVVDAYLESRGLRYRYDFVELIFEGYQTYVNGNIRASMVVTGEALLRMLYGRIAEVLQSGLLRV